MGWTLSGGRSQPRADVRSHIAENSFCRHRGGKELTWAGLSASGSQACVSERGRGPQSWGRGGTQELGPQGLLVQKRWSGFCSKPDEKPWRGFDEGVTPICIFTKSPWLLCGQSAFGEAREAGSVSGGCCVLGDGAVVGLEVGSRGRLGVCLAA